MGPEKILKRNGVLAEYAGLKDRVAIIAFYIRNSRFTNDDLDFIEDECKKARYHTKPGPDREGGDGPLQAPKNLDAQYHLNQYWHDIIFHPCVACASHNGPKV
jgi:hypothetical protein